MKKTVNVILHHSSNKIKNEVKISLRRLFKAFFISVKSNMISFNVIYHCLNYGDLC
jgi:hypothetical protein